MAREKINITDKLRTNIIELRKERSISAYDLSESSGHSKYWLSNIESGKTQKIAKDDLISLYKVLYNTDEEEASEYIERIINQQVGTDRKPWYELVKINEDFEDLYSEDDLDLALEELLDQKLCDLIRSKFADMSVEKKQAALSALSNLYASFYLSPELAFPLINIPVFGIDQDNEAEYSSTLNEIMSTSAKYEDFVVKNHSREKMLSRKEFENRMQKILTQTIHLAFENFVAFIPELYAAILLKNPDLAELANKLNVDVSFVIERGQPNALKIHLKHFRIYNGADFAEHLLECIRFFDGFQERYDLPNIYDSVDRNTIDTICQYLEDYGEIR